MTGPLAQNLIAVNPVPIGFAVGAVGALAGRFVAPHIAALYAGRGPVARAGFDATLGCALTLTATLVTATLVPPDASGMSAIAAVLAGSVTALGVAWGSALGATPSGGVDDLAGGRARRLGAWLGVLAASPLVFA